MIMDQFKQAERPHYLAVSFLRAALRLATDVVCSAGVLPPRSSFPFPCTRPNANMQETGGTKTYNRR